MTKNVMAIDFGGTKMKFGIVTSEGKILGDPLTLPTQSERPGDEIVGSMISGIEQILQQQDMGVDQIDGIGIGSPGPLDLKQGIILEAPNLPTLHHFPLKQTLENYFGLRVAINNDGNCFVLGEAWFGSARDADIVCGATLGTGFGCGLVIGKKIFEGATGTAAEVWRSPYLDRTFEEYGSARSVTRIYHQITQQNLTAKDIFQLAQNRDAEAIATWEQYGMHLGKILAIITNLIDPDVIVIGGSVCHAWSFFAPTMKKHLDENINQGPREHLRVVPAALGDDAGLLGAAALLF